MRRISLLCLLLLPLIPALSVSAQDVPRENPQAEAIFAMLNKSAADWNRGDLDAFASSYKHDPDILFIGRKISRGYDQMLATYKANYATPEKMGQLLFTQLDTQRLDDHFATVTGHFHLERTTAGGGNADGYFLLVVEKTPIGWKIVRDDSTALPPPAAHRDSATSTTCEIEPYDGGQPAMLRRCLIAAALLSLPILPAHAQQQGQLYTATHQQLDVTKVLLAQEDAWNQGDLDGYLSHYKDDPTTQAILSTPVRGLEKIRAAYHTNYPNALSMGTLEQSEVEVRALGDNFALATGKFHITRPKKKGGDVDGGFTEIFEKTSAGWQVIFSETT